MTLLSINDIRVGLDEEYAALEPMLKGYRLTLLSPSSAPDPTDLEARLKVSLPQKFRALISTYDFGNLTIGPIAFCSSGNYLEELIDFNEQMEWWGSQDPRPLNLLMIANSDPYAILLNSENGLISAFKHDQHWTTARVVAKDFELFFRGIGTANILRKSSTNRRELGERITIAAHGNDEEFWVQLAM